MEKKQRGQGKDCELLISGRNVRKQGSKCGFCCLHSWHFALTSLFTHSYSVCPQVTHSFCCKTFYCSYRKPFQTSHSVVTLLIWAMHSPVTLEKPCKISQSTTALHSFSKHIPQIPSPQYLPIYLISNWSPVSMGWLNSVRFPKLCLPRAWIWLHPWYQSSLKPSWAPFWTSVVKFGWHCWELIFWPSRLQLLEVLWRKQVSQLTRMALQFYTSQNLFSIFPFLSY